MALKKKNHVYAEISLGICMSLGVTALDLCHITEDKAERKIVLAGLSKQCSET